MKMYKILLFVVALGLVGGNTQAQTERKVTFSGGARSVLNNNELTVKDSTADTLTMKKNNGGYALIDLGINIKPNKNTEIMGMFRIRNQYGGFWGSGVQFDVRQLWIKGVVANALRYQVGDLNLKQTAFTLYNQHADQIDSLPAIFGIQHNIVNYEQFYLKNNTWRMQGANVDFGLTFSKYLKEINVSCFITRLIPTDFASTSDRLMGGATVQLVGTKYFQVGFNTNSVFDVKGTVANANVFKNNVNSIDWKITKEMGRNLLSVNGEAGQSKYSYSYDTLSPKLDDYFVNAYASLYVPAYYLTATAGYLNVGPEFRSIGAQSKDVNYASQPVYFNRYTNNQQFRPLGLFDVIGNENIYNRTVSSKLMIGNPLYNNAMPYGLATFNRIGMYAKLQFENKKGIALNGEYYSLDEIKGQGTLSLKHFTIYKAYVGIPVNRFYNNTKTLLLHFGTNMQLTKRNSTEAIENIDFKSMQMSAGFRWEFATNFELLGGYVSQNSKGNEFTADRDAYTQVTYYTAQEYHLNQQIAAGGIRYNFTPLIYICALYQKSTYTDKLKQNADYSIDQFGLLFNMLF